MLLKITTQRGEECPQLVINSDMSSIQYCEPQFKLITKK